MEGRAGEGRRMSAAYPRDAPGNGTRAALDGSLG